VEETRESYDPAQSATLSMERSEQSTGAQPLAAGVPGTASNAPNTQPLPVYPRQTTQPQTSKTESGTYGVSKTVRHTIENPGQVSRLTAAIVVNDRLVQAATSKSGAQWQPRTADELRNLSALAQAAVGFNSSRGDVVTVQDISFEENHGSPAPSTPSEIMTRVEDSPLLVKYLSLLIGILAVLVLGIRPALRKAVQAGVNSAGQLPSSTVVGAAAGLPLPEVAAIDPGRMKAQQILEHVTSQLKQEPAQSSRLLQSWIHSDS
jgi:flagellar M-ring protein FliF